jgi:hypothetical protein
LASLETLKLEEKGMRGTLVDSGADFWAR